MDKIQSLFSKTKKKIKGRFQESGYKPGSTTVDTGGERATSTSSLPRPEPHVVVGGDHDQEGHGVGIEGMGSGQRNLHPEVDISVKSEPGREGSDVDGKKIDIDSPSSTPPSPPSGTRKKLV